MDVLPHMRNAGERVAKRNAVPQRAFGCALDHFAIRDGIAERHAELNDVCSGCGEFHQQKFGR